MQIPANAIWIMESLREAGYEAYLVGGCVRDTLLGRKPEDYDITTSALPEEIESVFDARGIRLADYGMKHGTVVLILDDGTYEVTTYRIDGEYTDGRRPDSVSFTRNIREDLARRDFTVNAMAMDAEGKVVDPYGGKDDLNSRILRAVGNPDVRFNEDALRIMRAIRFAAQLGFEIEEDTAEALHRGKDLQHRISGERIRIELRKLFESDGCVEILREYRDIIATVMPEIADMFDFDQCNPYHCHDVWEHSLHVVGELPKDETLRLAGLLHDVGKPSCFLVKEGWGHFYNHEEASAEMAERILRRLRYDNTTINDVVTVIKAHSAVFNATAKYARRKLNQLGEKRLRMLIALERADVSAQAYEVREERIRNIDEFARIVDEVLEGEQCFSLADLKVRGNDLLEMGIPRGPEIGRILGTLLELVIAGDLENDRDVLLAEIDKIK